MQVVVVNGFMATNLSRPSPALRNPAWTNTNRMYNGIYMSSNSKMNAQQKQKHKFRSKLNSLKQMTSKSKLASSTSINFANPNSSSPKEKLLQLFSKLRNINEVTKWRMAAFTFISSIFAFSPKLDIILVNVWHWLLNGSALLPRVFRHDHWEWGVAVVAFFFLDSWLWARRQGCCQS